MKPKPLNLDAIQEEVLKDNKLQEYYIGKGMLGINGAIYKTIWVIEQRIKLACEFYLKYKDKPTLLLKEHPEYESTEFSVELDENFKEDFNDFMKKYNEWLFKLAFKDVLGGDINGKS